MTKLDSQLIPSFLAVATTLNFTEAAKMIGATQSGLSQHIAKLELALGAQLFIRTNKKVLLTNEGIAFKQYAENFMQLENDLFEKITGEKSELDGEVHFAMPESCLLTPHLANLLQKRRLSFEKLNLKVTIADHQQIIQMVLLGEVDFAFCTQNIPLPGLRFDYYCNEEYVLVGKKEFLKELNSIEALKKIPFIMHPGFTEVMEAWWKKQKPRQSFPSLNIVASVNHFLGMKTFLVNGVGVSIVPRQCVEDELKDKSLVQLLPDLNSVSHPINIVTLSNRGLNRRTQRIIDEFHQMIATN